jgi:hypothetical protein
MMPAPSREAMAASEPISAQALLQAMPSVVVTASGTLVDARAQVASALGVTREGGKVPPRESLPVGIASSATAGLSEGDPALTVIKVRLDGARGAIVLRLHADDETVSGLYARIATAMARPSSTFELRSAAPPRALPSSGDGALQSLRVAGLAPSASLFSRVL